MIPGRDTRRRMQRRAIILWGLLGVTAILGNAVRRVVPVVDDALQMTLTWPQIAFGIGWLAFMAYSEGYRGFQQRFAPRVVARAWYLADHPRPLHVLLAPFFCIGYFHGSRRRMITSWALTVGITAIVLVVRQFPQPWRGIVDAGVVLGLTWGLVAVLVWAAKAVRDGGIDVDPQLPEGVAVR